MSLGLQSGLVSHKAWSACMHGMLGWWEGGGTLSEKVRLRLDTMEDGGERRPTGTSAGQSVTAGEIWNNLEQAKEEALPGITVGSLGQLRKACGNPEQQGTARNTSNNLGIPGRAWDNWAMQKGRGRPGTTGDDWEQRGMPGTARVNRRRQEQYGQDRKGWECLEYVDILEDIKRDSLDFYATIRSLQRQRRDNDIRDGDAPDPLDEEPSKCCIEPLSFDETQ